MSDQQQTYIEQYPPQEMFRYNSAQFPPAFDVHDDMQADFSYQNDLSQSNHMFPAGFYAGTQLSAQANELIFDTNNINNNNHANSTQILNEQSSSQNNMNNSNKNGSQGISNEIGSANNEVDENEFSSYNTYPNSGGYLSSDYQNQSLNESTHSSSHNYSSSLSQQYQYQQASPQYQHQQYEDNTHNNDALSTNSSSRSSQPPTSNRQETYYQSNRNVQQNNLEEEDDEGSEDEGDNFAEQRQSGNNVIDNKQSRVKKHISKKKYEPLYDNNQVYTYEENPAEYKKARKRVQNRISARKVRSVQKNVAENLEVNVERLQQQNHALREQIAKLTAENTCLKNEVTFLRNTFRENQQQQQQQQQHQSHPVQAYNYQIPPNQRQNISPDQLPSTDTLPYTVARSTNPRKVQSNGQLFMVALVSCILVMSYSSVNSDMQYNRNVILEFQKDINNIKSSPAPTVSIVDSIEQFEKTTKILVQQSERFEIVKQIGWSIAIISYIVYVGYILYTIFKGKYNAGTAGETRKNKEKIY